MSETAETTMTETQAPVKEKKPRKSRRYFVGQTVDTDTGASAPILEALPYPSLKKALDSLSIPGRYRIFVQVDEVTVSEKTVKEIKR